MTYSFRLLWIFEHLFALEGNSSIRTVLSVYHYLHHNIWAFFCRIFSKHCNEILMEEEKFVKIEFERPINQRFCDILSFTYLAAATNSLNIFHSRLSQNLFLFLSINKKLSVAIRSSSLVQLVIFALFQVNKTYRTV